MCLLASVTRGAACVVHGDEDDFIDGDNFVFGDLVTDFAAECDRSLTDLGDGHAHFNDVPVAGRGLEVDLGDKLGDDVWIIIELAHGKNRGLVVDPA